MGNFVGTDFFLLDIVLVGGASVLGEQIFIDKLVVNA